MGLDHTLKKIGLMQPCIFKVPDLEKLSGQPDKLDIRVQIDWANAVIDMAISELKPAKVQNNLVPSVQYYIGTTATSSFSSLL